MINSVSKVIADNENTTLFLVDIGVWGFRDILKKYPERAMNCGIFEDGMISVTAGMSLAGLIPFVYGISPFILGRVYDQLKLDFCYQKLAGNFITTGAAYDFSKLGYSHYCPEDIELARTMPGLEFIAAGTSKEFETLFNSTWNDDKPTYYRLSDYCNKFDAAVSFGKATVIKTGSKGVVIAVSTMLDVVMAACSDEDVTILYYTTLLPFDRVTLRENLVTEKILLCEPHFEGALLPEIIDSVKDCAIRIKCVGVPRKINRNYGTKIEKDIYFGLTEKNLRSEIKKFFNS